jgi:hypothetical protein
VTSKRRAAQRYFESHGCTLVGLMPGATGRSPARGGIKRVVEAAFVKCLAGPDALLAPEISNVTSTV